MKIFRPSAVWTQAAALPSGRAPARALILIACLGLGACGLHPLYGRASLAPELASIYVEPIAERDGFELRNSLIDLLQSDGEQAGKAYRLKITLNESSQGIALENDATISRYNNTLTVRYTLSDAKGTVLTTATQSEMSAYNVVQSPYATLAAAQDSSKRAAEDMAERIHLDLGVWFRHHRK